MPRVFYPSLIPSSLIPTRLWPSLCHSSPTIFVSFLPCRRSPSYFPFLFLIHSSFSFLTLSSHLCLLFPFITILSLFSLILLEVFFHSSSYDFPYFLFILSIPFWISSSNLFSYFLLFLVFPFFLLLHLPFALFIYPSSSPLSSLSIFLSVSP